MPTLTARRESECECVWREPAASASALSDRAAPVHPCGAVSGRICYIAAAGVGDCSGRRPANIYCKARGGSAVQGDLRSESDAPAGDGHGLKSRWM